MSKKNKSRQGKIAVQTINAPGNKVPKPTSAAALNWLLVVLAVFPFLLTRETIDPALPVRYAVLSGFTLLFLIYFFGIKKRAFGELPQLVQLVFFLGLGYGLWNTVSMFFAVNKQQVYYGLSRHLLNLVLLLILTDIVNQHQNLLLRLCKLLSVAAFVHGIIGLLQFYDAGFNDLPGNFPPYGFMANRNFFGSAQVLLMPFAAYVLYKGNQAWKIVGTVSLVLIITSALLSQTRAAWIAALVMIFLSLILILLFSPSNRKRWLSATAFTLLSTALIVFLLIQSDTEGQFSRELKERSSNLVSVTLAENPESAAGINIQQRLRIWNKTLEVIQDKWLTGVGLENWKITVQKYGSEGIAWDDGVYVPDTPHNEYLLVLAESGVPGAILFFGMWVLVVIIGFKILRSPSDKDLKVLVILMLSGIAGFAADSVVSFPLARIEHSFYFYLMGAIILGLYIKSRAIPAKSRKMPLGLLFVMTGIALFNLFLAIKKISFEKHFQLAQQLEQERNYTESIEAAKKSKNNFVNLAPNGVPAEAHIASSQTALKNYSEALTAYEQAIKLSPYKQSFYVNTGIIYSEMGKYDTAIKYYQQALKLSTKIDMIYHHLAVNYFYLKDYKSTVETLNKVDISGLPVLINVKKQAEELLGKQQ